jgi:transketolase
MTKSIDELSNIATQIRRDIVRMVHAVNSGHPGGSLGCTEYFTALYSKVMNYKLPLLWKEKEKIFLLSNGHISPVFIVH